MLALSAIECQNVIEVRKLVFVSTAPRILRDRK